MLVGLMFFQCYGEECFYGDAKIRIKVMISNFLINKVMCFVINASFGASLQWVVHCFVGMLSGAYAMVAADGAANAVGTITWYHKNSASRSNRVPRLAECGYRNYAYFT